MSKSNISREPKDSKKGNLGKRKREKEAAEEKAKKDEMTEDVEGSKLFTRRL